MSAINDFLIRAAKKRMLRRFQSEIEKYREKISKTDSDMFLNVFNSGVYVNVKRAGDMLLTLANKVLEKERKKRS